MGKLAKADPRDIDIGGIRLTRTGVDIVGKVDKASWVGAMQLIDHMGAAMNWCLGDLLLNADNGLVEGLTPDEAEQLRDDIVTAVPTSTQKQCQWVSDRIKKVTRVTNLSWTHHREVAGIKVAEDDVGNKKASHELRSQWLQRAEKEGWTKAELRQAIHADKLAGIVESEAGKLSGVFDVIVCDPPWPMEKIHRDTLPDQGIFDYPIMQEDELAALEIPMAEDCHFWLWTTHKFVPMAHRLLDAWGLNYVCTFVWHKNGGFQPFGLPQYNSEFALYARFGSPQFVDTKDFMTCFDAPRGEHSKKPEEFYDVIRRVTGGRRLDMFNRRNIEGFTGWGKESV